MDHLKLISSYSSVFIRRTLYPLVTWSYLEDLNDFRNFDRVFNSLLDTDLLSSITSKSSLLGLIFLEAP